MADSSPPGSGCFRTGLIFILVSVSLSMAVIYWIYNSGLYKGRKSSDDYLVIKNGRIFNGISDSIIHGSIVLKDGDILCVGECEEPEDAEIMDADGRSIIPGLTDMMIQFYAPSYENNELSDFRRFLTFTQQRPEVRRNLHLAGITSIRSIGDALGNILSLRKQITRHKLAGPRIYCSGLVFTASGGFPADSLYRDNEFMLEEGVRLVNDPETARVEANSVIEEGVDGLKIVYHTFGGKFARVKYEVLSALIQTAHHAQKWVSVHTGSSSDIVEAAGAGANTLEYGSYEPLDSLSIQAMVRQQTLYIPALIHFEKNSNQLAIAQENVMKAYRAGVPIGVGTDTQGYLQFGKSLHREMELLVEAGLDPQYVIKSATWLAASYLKKDDILGAITSDRHADLVIVNGTPWENISDIRNVYTVLQEGRIVVFRGEIVD